MRLASALLFLSVPALGQGAKERSEIDDQYKWDLTSFYSSDEAWDDDVRYMSGQDVATTPQADQWANGTDMAADLERMMDVRAAAMSRFGEAAIQNGMPVEEEQAPLSLRMALEVGDVPAVKLPWLPRDYRPSSPLLGRWVA